MYLLSELVLLDELFELLGQLHVLLPQLGVVGAMLFHLHLNITQGHLEVQHSLFPLLLVLPRPLSVFLLSGNRSENERRSTKILKGNLCCQQMTSYQQRSTVLWTAQMSTLTGYSSSEALSKMNQMRVKLYWLQIYVLKILACHLLSLDNNTLLLCCCQAKLLMTPVAVG